MAAARDFSVFIFHYFLSLGFWEIFGIKMVKYKGRNAT